MRQQFRFECKSISPDGTFVGLGAVYNNVDLGNDMILPGAFTKTLNEKGREVPLLMGHDSKMPIGRAELSDSPQGLLVHGTLILEADGSRSAYALLKAGVIKGLSIGYDTLKSKMVDGVRHLSELKLWEISLTAFPMNELATVTSVKSGTEIQRFRALLAECKGVFSK
jgi:Escherichia/Staphylococcus phage prohead protease